MSVKPIFSLRYDLLDWWGAETDAKFIEFCISSFDSEHFSLRVHRIREDGNYNRMSEQLPLHRPIDLLILLIKCFRSLQEENYNIHFLEGLFGKDHESNITPECYATIVPQLRSKAKDIFNINNDNRYFDFVLSKLKALQTLLNEEVPKLSGV